MLLYRYIIKEHIFPFLASLGIIIFLFIMQQAIFMLDRIVSKNIDPQVVLEVFLIQLGWILALGIPMAILSATLMTYGRMSGDNEITAIKASGRSMTALMTPAVAAGAVMMVMLFFFHDLILPEANHRAANLLGDISRKRPAAFIDPGVLIRDFPGYTLYTEEVNSTTGDLKGVRIFVDDPSQDPSVTIAEHGNIRVTGDEEYIELTLVNGETHNVSRSSNGKDYFVARFGKQIFHLKNIDTKLERTESGNRGDREMPISAMLETVRGFRESNAALTLEYNAMIDTLRNFITHIDTLDTASIAVSDADAAVIGANAAVTGANAAVKSAAPIDANANVNRGRSPTARGGAGRRDSAARTATVNDHQDNITRTRPVTARTERADSTVAEASLRQAQIDSALTARRNMAAPSTADSSDTAAMSFRDPRRDSSAAVFYAWGANLRSGARGALNRIRQDAGYVTRYLRATRTNDLQIAQYMVEVHKKFSIPAACIIFVLIGAPLGIMARRGGLAVGASYSVFFFIIYWVFLITGENMADKLIISPAVGMWAGNVFLLACGIVLMILMLRETSISFAFVKRFFGKSAPIFTRISRMWIFKLPGIIFKAPRVVLSFITGKLPTYLIGMFLGYAFGLLAALVIIFITIDYVSNLNRFANASRSQLIMYYYYYMPWICQTVLPIVLFLSSMFSMGRLAKTSELTAMKAAGINVRQLTTPLLLIGLLISGGIFLVGEEVIPKANEQRRLIRGNFSKDATAADQPKTIREYRRNFFYFGTPNIMYVFNEFCTEPQFFRNVTRYTFNKDGLAERVEAPEVLYDSTGGWRFANGRALTFDKGSMAASKFDTLPDTILKAEPLDMVKRLRSVEEMSYWELSGFIEAGRRRGDKVQKYMAELEFKIALPFMNFIVILFGLSLSARTARRGGGAMLFGIGLLLSFLFWIFSRFMLVFAQNGFIPITFAAWVGNIIFLCVGLILYRKAAY